MKGLGGYHLAVDASSEAAAAALRARKHREDKPFAVMVADVAAGRPAVRGGRGRRRAAGQQPAADRAAAPAAVGRRRGRRRPGNRQLGLMLPYTPLHHLLLAGVGRADGADQRERLGRADRVPGRRGGASGWAGSRTPSSPTTARSRSGPTTRWCGPSGAGRRCSAGPAATSRNRSAWRSRFARPVLACGAELKSTFCLARESHAFVSHHIGDLENAETLRSFTEGIEHFRRLFDITPEVVAHDLHPEYLSTKYAAQRDLARRSRWRARRTWPAWSWWACSTTTRTSRPAWPTTGPAGPVIGVAFDGTGYGTRRHHLGRRVPDRRPGRIRAGRAPGAGADARRRGRDPAAVADGRGLPRRRLPGRRRPAARTWPGGTSGSGPASWPWPGAGSTPR